MKEIKSDKIQFVIQNGHIIGKKQINTKTFSKLYLNDNSIYSIVYINDELFLGEEIDFSELSDHTDHLPFTNKALKKYGFIPKINTIYCQNNGKVLKVNELKNLFNYLHNESSSNEDLIKHLKNLIS